MTIATKHKRLLIRVAPTMKVVTKQGCLLMRTATKHKRLLIRVAPIMKVVTKQGCLLIRVAPNEDSY